MDYSEKLEKLIDENIGKLSSKNIEDLTIIYGNEVGNKLNKAIDKKSASQSTTVKQPTVKKTILESEIIEEYNKYLDEEKYLPIEFKKAIEALKGKSNYPVRMSLVGLLSVANYVTQRQYDVKYLNIFNCPTNCFITAVAESSGGKSSLINIVGQELFNYQELNAPTYKDELQMYNMDLDLYNEEMKDYAKQRRINQKQKDDNNNIKLNDINASVLNTNSTVLTLPKKPVKPLNSKIIYDKFTEKGLIDAIEDNPSIIILASEAYILCNWQAEDKKRQTSLFLLLNDLHSGKISRNVTGKSNDKRHIEKIDFKARATFTVFIQPNAAKELFGDKTFKDRGVLSRISFIDVSGYCYPEMIIDEDEEFKAEEKFNLGMKPFHNKIYNLIRKKLVLDENNDIETTLIEADKEAAKLFKIYFNNVLNKLTTINKFKEHNDYITKGGEIIFRIAATLAVFEENLKINVKNMKAAISIFNMFVDERIKYAEKIDDITRNEEILLILKHLINKEEKEDKCNTASKIYNYNKTKIINLNRCKEIINDMYFAQNLIVEKMISKKGNKTSVVYEVTNKGREFYNENTNL